MPGSLLFQGLQACQSCQSGHVPAGHFSNKAF